MLCKLHYTILVTGPAYGNQKSSSALQFTQALLNYGHYINAIFFYQDGVYNANSFTIYPSNEINLVQAWQKLAIEHQLSLHVCISAALRRGITNAEQALQLNLSGHNLPPAFNLSSLITLGESILTCDRFIQF
ncbi:tRNA 5-methylaminomethyl-2-thiouridine synthase [Candidatus Palibaumannia cicadellinicola]|uniref:tRNA 5-methylaminomethyl-2-thiouridine synthase n=2 Tax=Candidatus Palibaumannia cicadellinicola TaxID=186490 RepID=A0A0K2BKX2_9GAMM|nr:tRNA 5-methylaminomethyl-2-thiouridine synthase [Candidatus Baumannia cicadellinicola]